MERCGGFPHPDAFTVRWKFAHAYPGPGHSGRGKAKSTDEIVDIIVM